MNPDQQNNGGGAPNGKFFCYKIIDFSVVFECQIFVSDNTGKKKQKKSNINYHYTVISTKKNCY